MWVLADLDDFILVNLDEVQYLQIKEHKKLSKVKLMAFIPGAKGTTKAITLKSVSRSEWQGRLRPELIHRLEKHSKEIWDFTKAQYWGCNCKK